MTGARRGFGIAAATPESFIEALASAAEDAKYSTFWVNDTPGSDGLALLGKAAAVTQDIRLGVGVIPLDRRSPEEIAMSIEAARIPADRLIVGVGSGGRFAGSLELVREGIATLRALTSSQIAIGALGTKMIALSGEIADAVLLNWLTPEWALSSTETLRWDGAASTELVGYVRTALPVAHDALEVEASRYAAIPQYARHFEQMGVPAIGTCVLGESAAIQAGLKAFEQHLDETVVRAIVASQTFDAYFALLQAARPV
ncbi:MAG: LLM class flavin-dependent oxidoreductase [Thermomicrobiales bacterium]